MIIDDKTREKVSSLVTGVFSVRVPADIMTAYGGVELKIRPLLTWPWAGVSG
jgi:hypothetical protein